MYCFISLANEDCSFRLLTDFGLVYSVYTHFVENAHIARVNLLSSEKLKYNSSDGDVWACGDNNMGQLGIGGKGEGIEMSPRKVQIEEPVVHTACGLDFTLFVTKSGRDFFFIVYFNLLEDITLDNWQ